MAATSQKAVPLTEDRELIVLLQRPLSLGSSVGKTLVGEVNAARAASGWQHSKVFEPAYARFDVCRPPHLAAEYWMNIETELLRLTRSLDAADDVQAIGDAKCLVESVAKIVWDINGTPTDSNESFPKVVARAHDLLRNQPGHELAHGTTFANLAMQASKMAGYLAEIRNSLGGGHGRARQPYVRAEEVDLVLDGALTWVRWALRRIGLFAEGRPDELIRDLIGSETESQVTFTKGLLARRLAAADLPRQPERYQRALGVAVGQRSAGNTFVVIADGFTPAAESDDLDAWPPQYRVGLAYGRLFDLNEQPTLSTYSIPQAMKVMAPVEGEEAALEDLVERIVDHFRREQADSGELSVAASQVEQVTDRITAQMKPAMQRLATFLRPAPR